MPIDRKLALESLRKCDEELYYVCSRLEEVKEYLSSDPELSERLQHYLYYLDTLDFLERQGRVGDNQRLRKKGSICQKAAVTLKASQIIRTDKF